MKKIWIDKTIIVDSYVDFYRKFNATDSNKSTTLNVSADSNFICKINNQIVGFGSRTDYPTSSEHYSFNITQFVKNKNKIEFTVWYYGEDNHSYIQGTPFLAFQVLTDKSVLLESDEKTLCRYNPYYKQNYRKKITSQLGFSFLYDSTKTETKYNNAIVVGKLVSSKKTIKNLQLLETHKNSIIKCDNGYLIDLFEEVVGFLTLDITSTSEQRIVISYGEDLKDGLPRRYVLRNDFSVEYVMRIGENNYVNYFRRIAGRYLFVEAENVNNIVVNNVSIIPVVYPVDNKKILFQDKTLQKIYDVGIRTLKCCMHEHYEDCPWREQAIYALDCRNQMLCGYFAFNSTEFQRYNIIKLAESVNKDGLLSICALSNVNISIPFFSLFLPIIVFEYLKYTKDYSILSETKDALDSIINAFHKRFDENGLIKSFDYPYWNFYEWTDGSDNWNDYANKLVNKTPHYSFILNAMYVYSKDFYNRLFGTKDDTSELKLKLKDVFYDKERNVYRLSTNNDKSSVLCNSLAVLIGISNHELERNLLNKNNMIDISLSMNIFYYDAIIKISKNYKNIIIEDIKKQYGVMIEQSATTFWETLKGSSDFNGLGSLCHGWSALPVYYLSVLCKKKGEYYV